MLHLIPNYEEKKVNFIAINDIRRGQHQSKTSKFTINTSASLTGSVEGGDLAGGLVAAHHLGEPREEHRVLPARHWRHLGVRW